MRTVELAKVAATAEALRLRTFASRQAMRAAYGAGAAVFGIALLVMVHVLLFFVLRVWLSPLVSSVIVLVIDAIAAGILGYLALNNTPSATEIEAEQIRAQALIEMRRSISMAALSAEVAAVVLRRGNMVGHRNPGVVVAEMLARSLGR